MGISVLFVLKHSLKLIEEMMSQKYGTEKTELIINEHEQKVPTRLDAYCKSRLCLRQEDDIEKTSDQI